MNTESGELIAIKEVTFVGTMSNIQEVWETENLKGES